MGKVYGYACACEPYGYVYFIRDGLGHVKIGVTENVSKRLLALQTANPMKLEYYKGLRFMNVEDAKMAEKELHKMFKKDRLCGEWFKEERILEFVDKDHIEVAGYKFA